LGVCSLSRALPRSQPEEQMPALLPFQCSRAHLVDGRVATLRPPRPTNVLEWDSLGHDGSTVALAHSSPAANLRVGYRHRRDEGGCAPGK
jgi:hypothetical protein